jgi:parallel beta-helix repeat protein
MTAVEHPVTILSDYVVHDPIVITSDDDFEAQGWPGNGTIIDPYMIEGFSIDGRLSPSELYCISIENTRTHFIIYGCFLYESLYGIYLENVTNGILQSNDCAWNDYGIYLDRSHDNSILDNNCYYQGSGASRGVYLMDSDYNTITSNTCFNKYEAIIIWDSINNTIINNSCYYSLYGIRALASHNATIANNNCSYNSNYGIDIWDSNYVAILNNTCNNIVGSNSYAISIVANWGPFVHNVTLKDNICNNNNERGIYIDDGKDFVIDNNTCNYNQYGFDINGLMNSNFTENTAVYNSVEGGIALRAACMFNTIYNNTFGWNGGLIGQTNAQDTGVSNSWDDNLSLGNRWGDYKGLSSDYTIPGSANSIDKYPMKADTTIPVIEIQSDFEYEYGSLSNSITWFSSDDHPETYLIMRNGTPISSGIWDGMNIVLSINGLDLGTYNYTLTISDTCGNVESNTVFVGVIDTTNPVIDNLDDFQYEGGSSGNNILWIASDLKPDYFEIFRNETQIGSGQWDGSNIQISVDGLDLGTYNYTLVVSDTSNNIASSTVLVSVVDTINPVVSNLGDIQFEIGTIGHNLTWTLEDSNPFSYEVFINSTSVFSGAWNSTGETVTITLDSFDVGTHFISIIIKDLAGNEASDEVIVSVLSEITTTVTDTPTTNPLDDSQFQFIAVLGIGVGVGVIIMLIVIIVFKKK